MRQIGTKSERLRLRSERDKEDGWKKRAGKPVE